MQFDPMNYGPVLCALVDTDRKRPLDAGARVTSMTGALSGLSIENAFDHTRVASRDMASCCISAVWLLYDFLDESHTISQNVHNASGSYWHAIMHRREGDFSNAKYWFRHVGAHPIYRGLASAVQELTATDVSEAAREFAQRGDWYPYGFVDRCAAALRGKSADVPFLLSVQQAEWELLFDHCYAQAIGRA